MADFSSRKQTNSNNTHTQDNHKKHAIKSTPPPFWRFFRAPNHRVKEMAKVAKTSSSCCQSQRKDKVHQEYRACITYNIWISGWTENIPPTKKPFFLHNRNNETVWVIVRGVGYMLRTTCMLIYFVWIICMGDIFKPQCFVHIFKWFLPWCFSLLVSWGVFRLGYEKQLFTKICR